MPTPDAQDACNSTYVTSRSTISGNDRTWSTVKQYSIDILITATNLRSAEHAYYPPMELLGCKTR